MTIRGDRPAHSLRVDCDDPGKSDEDRDDLLVEHRHAPRLPEQVGEGAREGHSQLARTFAARRTSAVSWAVQERRLTEQNTAFCNTLNSTRREGAPMTAEEWEKRHLTHVAKSKEEIFDAVGTLTTLSEPTFAWRGHASVDWILSPSVHRKAGVTDQATALKDGIGLLEEARARRFDRLPDGYVLEDLELMALLRHHAAATPLLDVTTDPFVALYFACEPIGDSIPGRLVAINVSSRGGEAHRARHFDLGEKIKLEKVFEQVGKGLGLYKPPDVSSRISAQRARFLLGPYTPLGFSTLPLETESWDAAKLDKVFSRAVTRGRRPKPAVGSIEISASYKKDLRTTLDESFGLNATTLFPDLPGFAAARGLN